MIYYNVESLYKGAQKLRKAIDDQINRPTERFNYDESIGPRKDALQLLANQLAAYERLHLDITTKELIADVENY